MSGIIAIAKNGFNALTETSPNNFLFHSTYNCFKIVATGTFTQALSVGTTTKSVSHNLGTKNGFYAYMYLTGITGVLPIRAERVNGLNLNGDGTIASKGEYRYFDVYSTTTTLEFTFSSADSDTATVRWYIFDNHV